ncbi:MAG TPA: alpha/beta hydrolase [Steroidobacteraceae bacterium]|nr:alpha/beta hydrolase [Steroidobacteraceae bacterium]
MSPPAGLAAESLMLQGPAGALEARVDFPAAAGTGAGPWTPTACAVVCHPHPLFGGTLTNKVVHTLARTFNDAGMPSLRFNFRGVGASAGTHDGGPGEVRDALAAVGYCRERWPHARPWLAGFSFGAAVAVLASAQVRPAGLVLVAPAVDRLDLGGVAPECPWLVLYGDADEVVQPARMLEWARNLQPQPTVQVMPGAGHYFHGRLPQLRDAVTVFVNENQRPGKT